MGKPSHSPVACASSLAAHLLIPSLALAVLALLKEEEEDGERLEACLLRGQEGRTGEPSLSPSPSGHHQQTWWHVPGQLSSF